MFIMLFEGSYVKGETLNEIMKEAIWLGYFESEAEFVREISSYEVYKLPDNPLKITGKMQTPVFEIET